MELASYIQHIRIHLIRTHVRVLDWFEVSDALKAYRPADGGWTVAEILEHIALTSHFLLILIDKGTGKALRNVRELSLDRLLAETVFDPARINAIGVHKSFDWIRPEHMEPTGTKSELTVKAELTDQLQQCLTYLDRLHAGEGLLYTTTMTVNGLGRLNVYEYIYFLSKHAERHLQQMEENRTEFLEFSRAHESN
ncbi:DinB family protein [Flavilitoribacter nigricans]|uniref:DinB-like domain-containing protein n=1 Tax=Flavilitoribacter nigricans (strain ATCC 23147 / DSM 23189 / NBRC 102662 / NCIMB 1420 / SS-2) TaxID=1122177 RepID=A0A2D0MXX7_FLAN2|nr:DinB family protein [Flavilitoribacter nigricans]PHN01095.1 hypothetical protein CRP01_38810 [Flavilitoribacter nigricans DSM 23189 = NBRC 102662]